MPTPPHPPTSVAVVGCGALGSFYGAHLCRIGIPTHFLLRSDFDTVSRHGVTIHSPHSSFTVHPLCARSPLDIGPVDLILIGLKTTANHQLPNLLPPLIHPGTQILTLQNGLGNEEALLPLASPDRIFGGLCFVCLNRIAPGTIRHLAHGRVVLGAFHPGSTTSAHTLASLFERAGIPCTPTANLTRAHWEKLVWNIPFNGLGVAATAGLPALNQALAQPDTHDALHPALPVRTTDQLLDQGPWEIWVRSLMQETLGIANTLGLALPHDLPQAQIDYTRPMGSYKASTLLDFEHHHPLELDSLFLKPLAIASAHRIQSPHLAALCHVLTRLATPTHAG